MSADVFRPAVLRYIDHGAFPQDEAVASATLTPENVRALSAALQREQNHVKEEIRALSRSTASHVDPWIARAQELQADILRSRDAARQIVAEAEAGRELKAKAVDQQRKVELLEQEVAVNAAILGRLELVKQANDELDQIRDALARGCIDSVLQRLEPVEESIGALGHAGSGVSLVLHRKAQTLRQSLREAVEARWQACIHVDVETRHVAVKDSLQPLVGIADGLGLYHGLVTILAKNIERAVIRPRLAVTRDGKVPKLSISEAELMLSGQTDDTDTKQLLQDLRATIDFLAKHLPGEVARSLASHLMPALSSRLEEEWLGPAVPLDISDMPAFQQLLADVEDFANHVDELRWHSSKSLHTWIQAAPKTWLNKRREALLGDVRNLVFTGIRERKTVEGAETQIVGKHDEWFGGSGAGDEDWDTAWDEPDEAPMLSNQSQQSEPGPAEDEDMMRAWDEGEPEEPAKEEETQDEDDAWDAWGEGDEPHAPAPATPKATTPQSQLPNRNASMAKNTGHEVTMRETFTVTAVPHTLLELLRQVIADSAALARPEHADSPIRLAAQGLYTLPTLALAIYRATAPTAYAKLETGNMLIYNDAMRLAEQLRAWQADQPPQSRLRLDNDVGALEQFAKRAYSVEMRSQRTILLDHLGGAQGFSRCSEQPFQSECKSAVEHAVLRLRDVHRMWESILSPSAHLQSVGSLLSTLMAKFIQDVEDLPDIGEADSRELKILCDTILEAQDFFAHVAPDGRPGAMASAYCRNWHKFQHLGEILVGTLADIRYLWIEGELSSNFESEELVGLIEALFADSRHRREAIQEVRSADYKARDRWTRDDDY